MKRITLFSIFLGCIGIFSAVGEDLDGYDEQVSIVQLIATPERFDGKTVTVIGFYVVAPESRALYLSKTDAELENRPSSIALEEYKKVRVVTAAEAKATYNHYVRVRGVFRVGRFGHGGLWKSVLTDVTYIVPARQK